MEQAHMESQPKAPSEKQEKTAYLNRRALRDIRDFFIKLAIMALAGWLLFGVIFGMAVMNGEDMYPRIRDGDLMVYFRIQQQYHVGDVVTFSQDGQRYTGRIVAQSGDRVEINENGRLLVNGRVQDEEIFYLTEVAEDGIEFPCEIPKESVFLLCDFRTSSTDSRNYGPVELTSLDGKVITILRRRGI